jgi:hypothetical protein
MPVEGLSEEPRTAALRQGLDRVHLVILTDIDGWVNISTAIDAKGGGKDATRSLLPRVP